MIPIINDDLLNKVITERPLRVSVTKESLLFFSSVYFPHYFGTDFAQFQYDMIQIMEDKECQFAVVITFRSSGKSTLCTTISSLWAIMGSQEKKHILIVCGTLDQVKRQMGNIKAELETNELLRSDLGPFRESEDTWNAMSLEFSKYQAKITAVSIDQSMRGLRYKQHRPDLVFIDDIEDSSSVKTKEGRKRIQELYSSEIAPIGDLKKTKMVLLGNYLHPNSLLATLREKIRAGKIHGRELFVPIMSEDGVPAWPQMFPTEESLEQLKERLSDHRAWMLEYMLKAVGDEDQLVTYNDIAWYDHIPRGWEPYFQFNAAGVDLAISKNDRADLTAIVPGSVFRNNGVFHLFIDPNPTNRRLNFRETVDFLMDFKNVYPDTHLFIEGGSYQSSLTEQLLHEGIDAHKVDIGKLSKLERLAAVAFWIRKGQIHFPKDRCTDLVDQMVNFGSEPHDDLVDAMTLLILQVMHYAKTGEFPSSLSSEGIRIRASANDWRKPRSLEVYNSNWLRRLGIDKGVWGTKRGR